MMTLRRRFVNLVAEKCLSSVCSLHRLDVSQHLFYPSTAEAEAAAKPGAVMELSSLPAPACNFQPATAGKKIEDHVFGLANPRISESRILWRSQEGNTFIYDVDSHTAWSMPPGLRYMGFRPVVISAPVPDDDHGEGLHVMSSDTGDLGFQVLRFDHSNPKTPPPVLHPSARWEWERLPLPPVPGASDVYAHAVLDGGRIICVSASMSAACLGAGTYLFDTVKRAWMRQAISGWQIPFFGAPQYIPDLNLWLGVSWSGAEDDSDRHHLCASSDLGAAVAVAARGGRCSRPPSVTVEHRWKEGLETPLGWETYWAQLLDLGQGRFCIAKLIREETEMDQSVGDRAALLTGVEMVRSSSSSSSSFRMVLHKSLRYVFRGQSIRWVL